MAKPVLVGIAGSDTTWATCTIVQADGQFCDAQVPDGAPISACKPHLVAAFLYCESLIAEQMSERDQRMSRAAFAEARAELRDVDLVYYARVGDLVKIGTTTRRNLSERMRRIRATCLLATEAGSYELEHRRHRQFRLSKAVVGTEYFRETDELVAHIRQLQMAAADRVRAA